ncbi:MAG: flagellar basal body P-ring formation chaperone FlgA [Syntrophales bacterium]
MKRRSSVIILASFCSLVWVLLATTDGMAAVLREGAIREIVASHIQRHMPWDREDVHLTFLDGCKDIVVTAPEYTCEVEERPNDPYIGDSSVILKLYHKGVFLLERSIRVRIEVAFDILVSTRALTSDTVIGSDDVRVVKRWLTREPQQDLISVEEAVGKRIRSTVRPNHDITRTMLRDVPLVKRGRLVKMFLSNGLINISTVGQIQEDGAMGSLVRVKNMTSQRVVYARVVGDSLVQVDF